MTAPTTVLTKMAKAAVRGDQYVAAERLWTLVSKAEQSPSPVKRTTTRSRPPASRKNEKATQQPRRTQPASESYPLHGALARDAVRRAATSAQQSQKTTLGAVVADAGGGPVSKGRGYGFADVLADLRRRGPA